MPSGNYGTNSIKQFDMTEEQFQFLARYEDNLRTAMTRKWARHPGVTAVKSIYNLLTELTGPRPRLNAMCQSCTLATLADAGKLYFAEKERREAMAQTERQAREAEAKKAAEAAQQEAEKPAETAAKPKAKKTPTKSAKAAEQDKPAKKPKAAKIEK